MRTIQYANGEYYHVYNRGVDKRVIFSCEDDFWRFYVSMFLFNDEGFNPARSRLNRDHSGRGLTVTKDMTSRSPFVDILSFCLMPNHFHLFVKQLVENGVSEFMRSLGQGFTQYFNLRYDRTGRLFEGSFKAVHIRREGQFLHMPRYIHLNLADLVEPDWREKGMKDWDRMLKFMESYKWSSHGVYLGKSQPLEVANPAIFKEIFKTPEKYLAFLESWAVKDWGAAKEWCLE